MAQNIPVLKTSKDDRIWLQELYNRAYEGRRGITEK